MNTVTIYSSQNCIHCTHAKEFFKDNNIQYTEHDVSDPKVREEAKEKSGQLGVPIIIIDNEVIIGFEENKIRELLSL